jgi:hypothetical protein
MRFASFKEQQHIQKQAFFVVMVSLELLRLFKPAGLSVFFSSPICSFQLLIWNFRVLFCSHEGTVLYRSSAHLSCRKEAGVSFVALGLLEPQLARY